MHRAFIPEEKYLIKLSVCGLGKFNAYNKTVRRNNTTYLHDGFFCGDGKITEYFS